MDLLRQLSRAFRIHISALETVQSAGKQRPVLEVTPGSLITRFRANPPHERLHREIGQNSVDSSYEVVSKDPSGIPVVEIVGNDGPKAVSTRQ